MMLRAFRGSSQLLFSVFALCLSSSVALAQAEPVATTVAGCDPKIMEAMNAKAQAQVAYDVAVMREIIKKPESVLTLTCFDKAAGVSAAQGGAVFSGDFTEGLSTVMTVTPGGYTCTAMNDLWDAISKEGINVQVPYATFDDLMNGDTTIPVGAGEGYTAGWTAAKEAGVFKNLSDKMTALDEMKPTPVDFTGVKSSCEVLVKAGIMAGPCKKEEASPDDHPGPGGP